jgi:hypothetical protein
MIKKLIILIMALMPFLVSAQTAADFFKFDELGPESTLEDIVNAYGKPSDITTYSDSSQTFVYTIDAPEYYDSGWVRINVSKDHKFTGYNIKVGRKEGSTDKILGIFKSKFGISQQLVNLFSLDDKSMDAEMKKLNFTFYPVNKRGNKAAWYYEYSSKESAPHVEYTVCDGQLYDTNRKKKVYELDIKF